MLKFSYTVIHFPRDGKGVYMTKEQFVTQLIQQLEPHFPKELYSIRTDIFTKNNDTKHYGLIIRRKTENMFPTIYVDDFYKDYIQKKVTLPEIAEQIQQVMNGFASQAERYHNFSLQWSDCQTKITYRVISKERNENLLATIPHIPFLNLAIVFYLVYNVSERGLESICTTEDLRNTWDISTKELLQLAEENTPRLFEPMIETMEGALFKYLGCDSKLEKEEIPPIYICSNEIGINGATVLIYKDFLQNFADKLQANLYIIPSSIHELLVIPDCGIGPLSYLTDMVRDINRTHVMEEEILSDCAYYYDHVEKRFIC